MAIHIQIRYQPIKNDDLLIFRLNTIYFAENWKHCNKIIFKCVNSTMGPIFNEKIDKNKICGSVNSARMHYSRKSGQMLRLLFMYSI